MIFHPVENSSETAEIIVPFLINRYKPKSVLDLGCNTGQWLKWFIHHGVADVIGIDGENMIPELVIPETKYSPQDLRNEFYLGRKFDLVLCLEVAEHLEQEYADVLVGTATMHSDIIFWSAANVGQGGYNHVNEQPMEYWIKKFNKKGFYANGLKNVLPDIPHIYYKNNAIEFIKGCYYQY